MRLRVLVLVLVLFIFSGCSALSTGVVDALNPLKEDKGISATVQLGKENKSESSKQLFKVDNKADYTNSVIDKVDYSINMPWWGAVLILIGGILIRPIDFIKDWRKLK